MLSGDGQSSATSFPPPLWGRDRERGGDKHRPRGSSRPQTRKRWLAAFIGSQHETDPVRVFTPLPVPPPQGGREPWGAHLRNSRNKSADGLPEMCACPSACAGTTAERAATEDFYLRRLSFAVNDNPPAPQHGQLIATRTFCFCSSSRSVRSSIARACCANSSCSEKLPALVSSSDDGGGELPNASGGGGGANVVEPLLGRLLGCLARAMAQSYDLRTRFTISSTSPRRKQPMLCSMVGSARSA